MSQPSTPESPTPLDPGRSIVTAITEDNRQIVCDHIEKTGEMVLSVAPIPPDIERQLLEAEFDTGKLCSKGVWYRIVRKKRV